MCIVCSVVCRAACADSHLVKTEIYSLDIKYNPQGESVEGEALSKRRCILHSNFAFLLAKSAASCHQEVLKRRLVTKRMGVAGSLGSMGVPVQYERNFRAKLAYFRAQCSSHFLNGHARLSISRDGLLEESFQQIQRLPASDLRKRLCITFLGEEGLDYGGIAR
ncbi:E3 ubiquitin-protein ligase Su dx [Taenia solium]|eukprot:TsM_001136300 transcript=TsM_001136300 gene=TsM_001136300